MAKTTLNPDGLPVPRGSYSLVNIAQPGRMVFIAGQTASDHEAKVIGATVRSSWSTTMTMSASCCGACSKCVRSTGAAWLL